eukprot:8194415-Pyramimonas_sp.AAC.1
MIQTEATRRNELFHRAAGVRRVGRRGAQANNICLTGIHWKIVSTYEPKITLAQSPAGDSVFVQPERGDMPLYVARIEKLYEPEASYARPSEAGQKWMHIQCYSWLLLVTLGYLAVTWRLVGSRYYRSAELPPGVREAH